MKFYCDACNTKYAISDDKVRGKVLKVRCKNCGNVITVREAVAPAASQRATDPMPDMQRGADNVPTSDWYYALNGQTFGPFSLDGLRRKYATAEIGDATYVWHEQLGDWGPVANEPAFAEALATGQKIVPSRQTIGFSGQLEAIKAPSDWKPAGAQAGAVPTSAKNREPERPTIPSQPKSTLPRAKKEPDTPKTPKIPTLPTREKSNVSAAPRKEQPNARPLKEVRQRNLERLRAKLSSQGDEPSEPELQAKTPEAKTPEPKKPEPKKPEPKRPEPKKPEPKQPEPAKPQAIKPEPAEKDTARGDLAAKLARVSSKPRTPEPAAQAPPLPQPEEPVAQAPAPEPAAQAPVVPQPVVEEPDVPVPVAQRDELPDLLANELLEEVDDPTFVEPDRAAISFELPPRAGKAAPSPSSTSDILDLAIGPLKEPPAPESDAIDSGLIPFTAEPAPAQAASRARASQAAAGLPASVNTSESLLIDMRSMNAKSRKRNVGGMIFVFALLGAVAVLVAVLQSNKEPAPPTPTPVKVAQKDELVIRTYSKEEVGRIQQLTLDDEVLTDEAPDDEALPLDDEPASEVALAAVAPSTTAAAKGTKSNAPKSKSPSQKSSNSAAETKPQQPENAATLQATQVASATKDPLAALLAPRADRRTEINAPQDKLLKKMDAGLSKDQARIGFQRVTRSIRDCRERHNRHNAQLEAGKLMVSVTVDPSGGVSEFTLSPRSVQNTEFHSCMQSHQGRWRFGEFAGDPVVINKSVVMQ